MKQIVSLFTVLLLTFTSAVTFAEGQSVSQQSATSEISIGKVNINSADADVLADVLHQIGEKKAAAIVEWRNTNGPFTSVEQLMEVKGIGEATLKANADKIAL